MDAKITQQVQQARNLSEARAILKNYRLELSDAIRKGINMNVGRPFIQVLRAEMQEVDNALQDEEGTNNSMAGSLSDAGYGSGGF